MMISPCAHSLLMKAAHIIFFSIYGLATPKRPGWPPDMGHCHPLLLHTVDHLSHCAVILHSRHATCFLWLYWISSHLHLHLHDHNQSILIEFTKALYAKLKFGSYILQDLYIKPELYCLCIFQDQARLIVRCVLRILWQKVIGASCYILAPQYLLISLMWNPCYLYLLASQFHLMCSFNTNDKRSHGSMFSHHTPFFLFLRMIPTPTTLLGSQKGPHLERWNLCFGEHIICISHTFHNQSPRAEFDSCQLLFARLRKMVSQLP